MEAGWPSNPDNAIVCILCRNLVPFIKKNPEVYFRHLISQHCAFFNLNLLLTLSLSQPTSVSLESENNPSPPSNPYTERNKAREVQKEVEYAIKTERMESEDCPVWYPVMKSVRNKENKKGSLPVIKMERDTEHQVENIPHIKRERDNEQEVSLPVIKIERDTDHSIGSQ